MAGTDEVTGGLVRGLPAHVLWEGRREPTVKGRGLVRERAHGAAQGPRGGRAGLVGTHQAGAGASARGSLWAQAQWVSRGALWE